MIDQVAKVGISVVVHGPPGYFLLGQRKGSHGAGEWWLPGGKPEPDETPMEAAIREVKEETGLTIYNVRPLPLWTYDRWPDFNRHFVCVYFSAKTNEFLPIAQEPDKCEAWHWVSWDNLPFPHDTSLSQLRRLYDPAKD